MQEKNKELPQEVDKKERIAGREIYEWVQALVCSVLAVVVIFTFGVRLIGVDGRSMMPTLLNQDRMLVLSSILYDDYRYGDVVVLTKETFLSAPIVKRVIAVENQTVDIDFESGSVYVDGKLLDEPYINELTFDDEGVEFPLTVPEGSIFVMGDNRNHSNDSRNSELGQINEKNILGKAVLRIYPFDSIGVVK